MTFKTSDRYSLSSLTANVTDSSGRLFFNDAGITDLSKVEIVGTSIDTVRQLFFGKPKDSVVAEFEDFETGQIVEYCHGQQWHFSKMGKVARYRYKLQNNELGLIILFGSYYETLDRPGQHLKIELSPSFISQRSIRAIWDCLHSPVIGLSHFFLDDAEPKGVAIHLAVDWQNYQIGADFVPMLSTRSSTIKAFDGISTFDLSDISEAVVSYGKNPATRNYMVGKASGLQTVVYNKSVEIIKSDKVDYFHHQWGVQSVGVHNPDKPVFRLENRLHHQIIREIGHFLGEQLESLEQVEPYLTDIWRYALDKNRYQIAKGVIHPLWQLFYEDLTFVLPAQSILISRKKKDAVDPEAKNIALIIGNMISMFARRNFNAKRVMQQLRILHFYPEIISYYESRGLSEDDLRLAVEQGLALRRLIGKAA